MARAAAQQRALEAAETLDAQHFVEMKRGEGEEDGGQRGRKVGVGIEKARMANALGLTTATHADLKSKLLDEFKVLSSRLSDHFQDEDGNMPPELEAMVQELADSHAAAQGALSGKGMQDLTEYEQRTLSATTLQMIRTVTSDGKAVQKAFKDLSDMQSFKRLLGNT